MSLPKCNFCDKEYDPHDMHTCAGNSIVPRKTWDTSTMETLAASSRSAAELSRGEDPFDPDTVLEASEPNDPPLSPTLKEAMGLTRQQIGEALDAERSALSYQPGGDHYRKMKIQPVEYIIANRIGFLPGNIIKYASRYETKGGAQDIRKIMHYCSLILEFEYGEKP